MQLDTFMDTVHIINFILFVSLSTSVWGGLNPVNIASRLFHNQDDYV